MQEPKKVTIRSLNDIVNNITEEELERFVPDFLEWLYFAVKTKKEYNISDTVINEMQWIDDGVQGLTKIEINGKTIDLC